MGFPGRIPGCRIDPPGCQQLFQFRGNVLAQQFSPCSPRNRHHGITVTDHDRGAELFGQHLGISARQLIELGHLRILAENHLAVRFGKNFECVALADTLGTADLFGDHHTAQFVNTAHNAGCSHCGTLPLVLPAE